MGSAQIVKGSVKAKQVLDKAIHEDDDVCCMHFKDADISIGKTKLLEFSDCVFTNCNFIKNNVDKLVFSNVGFKNCDLSNANMNGSVLQHVEILSSRAIGLILSQTIANQVLVRDCVFRYLNLNLSRWKNSSFDHTDLSNACMQESKLNNCHFVECNLTGAELFRTPLNGMDFTTDIIEGISILGEELKGAIVNMYQASNLAKLLGVVIK